MEILSKTKSGDSVRLWVDQDRHGVHQVYAVLMGGSTEKRRLCHGWGFTKMPQGMLAGILAEGGLIEVPREDWKAIVAVREDRRNRDNLKDIHLVKVFFRGDRLSVDAYTLSAGIDRQTWHEIEPYMRFIDSDDNDTLYAGDRFVGWVIEAGQEAEVERLLDVKPERLIRPPECPAS